MINRRSSSSLPPGPKLPSIAQLVRMSMSPYGWLAECRARYGDIFTLHNPGAGPHVFLANPEAVREVTSGGYDDFQRDGEAIRFLLGDHALIFQQDAQHKQTRKLMMPPFHGERMRAYGRDMAAITDEFVDQWRDGEERILHKELQAMAMRIILRVIFGIEETARGDALGSAVVEWLDALMTPWFYGATLVLSGRRVRDFFRWLGPHSPVRGPFAYIADRVATIRRILDDEIARCRALPDDVRARRTDILAMLIDARYEDGAALDDDELRDHLLTLLIGGHETTATTLAWALACALGRPGTVERMRDEVDRVFAGGFDAAGVKQLAYVGAVINESMRLYPVATAVTRILKTPRTFGGWTLPAGMRISPCIYLVQRDARLWPEPNEFRPERFVDSKASMAQFFPFGAGVWRCIGAQLAEYEMRVVLARIVARVDMTLVPGAKIEPLQRGFTVAPSGGVAVTVSRRA